MGDMQRPGGDIDDFSPLAADGVKWIKADFLLGLAQGATAADLPPEAFDNPSDKRTCFVSYAQEDPQRPGLSKAQQAKLRDAIARNRLMDRLFFIDHVSLAGKNFYLQTEAAEVLSFSRFIILEDVDSSAADKTPYL